jgi:beta-lactam-binding protein with PASTA domain
MLAEPSDQRRDDMPTDSQFDSAQGDKPSNPTEVVVVDPGRPEPVVIAESVVVADDQDTISGTRVVAETQAAVVEPDGTVTTTRERVEERTVVARERRNWLWPLLGLLGLLLAAGLLAWWYFSSDDTKQVPNVVGSSLTTAVNRLQQADFKSSITRSTHPEQAGIVFAQVPAASVKAKKGSVVQISVSNGPGLILVPSAVGLSDASARQSLVNAGLQVTEVRVFSSQPAGTVIAQSPAAGAKVASDRQVRINVSKGSGTAVVPNAVGLGEAAARSGIVAAGFRVTEVHVPSTQPVGSVIAQSPVAGSRAADGTVVRINVAGAATGSPAATPPPTTTAATTTPTTPAQPTSAQVPTASGPVQGAAQALAAAGFRVSVAYVPGTAALGTVTAQQPAAGNTAPTGSHITINVSSGPGQSTPSTVPDVVGKTIPEGVSAFNQAGLRLIFLRLPVTDKGMAGKIIEQSPSAGANAPKNAQILVYMGAYQR